MPFKEMVGRVVGSIWFFPLILTVVLLILSGFRVHGSSVGVYHQYIYGDTKEDSSLLLGKYRPIRSDEWLVNTQSIISQTHNDLAVNNPNYGNGQDMSVVVDAPYKDWSSVFKPHNFGFFFLSLDSAFSLRWWAMAYLLILSGYFLALKFLPGKRLIAALLSLALFFSPFVQWWYVYGTLGSIYWSFFIILAAMAVINNPTVIKKLLYSVVLTYSIVAFALVMYPPFQIPAAIVVLFFVVGYLLDKHKNISRDLGKSIALGLLSLVMSAIMIWGFTDTRKKVFNTVVNTDYPGERSLSSGGFSLEHLMSSHLSANFLIDSRAYSYRIDGHIPTNQSEASSFILLMPFIVIPLLYLAVIKYRSTRRIPWLTYLVILASLLFVLKMFSVSFYEVSKVFFLDKVGVSRAMIGLGIANYILVLMFIKEVGKYSLERVRLLKPLYILITFLVLIYVSLRVAEGSPGFIGSTEGLLFTLPIVLIVAFLLYRKNIYAVATLFIFSLFSTGLVNPLYQGLDIVTQNDLSKEIRKINNESPGNWISPNGFLINMGPINGVNSFSGVYSYPQGEVWESIPGVRRSDYNRYAHAGFNVSDDVAELTRMELVHADSVVVHSYACSDYLANLSVNYIVSTRSLDTGCTELIKSLAWNAANINIYRLRN